MKLKIFGKEIAITDMLFPVGSIYWTEDTSFSPSSIFGGTWEKITDRFIYATGSEEPGSQGGNSSITITANNIPRHRHTVTSHLHSAYASTSVTCSGGSISSTAPTGSVSIEEHWTEGTDKVSTPMANASATISFSIPNHTHSYSDPTFSITSTAYNNSSYSTANTTGSATPGTSKAYTKNPNAVSIIPPYEIAICWKRTA